jgi:diphthamide synthase (EF-2-diphthine--ammonia ligase)
LNVARKTLMHLSLAEFKALLRDQSFVLQLERERAVEALAVMVPQAQARKDLLKQVNAIVSAGDLPLATERDRLSRLAEVLGLPIEQPMALETSGET